MTEIADSRKNTVANEVGIDAKGVKAMMHQMIGAGVPNAHTKLCMLKRSDDPMFILSQSLSCQHADVKDNIEYMSTWYPSVLQHENKGILHLISPEFTDWSKR